MKLNLGLELIGNIVLGGIKLWSAERRKAFQDEHFEILEELENAKRRVYPEYTDIDVSFAKKKYKNFLKAYRTEQDMEAAGREDD